MKVDAKVFKGIEYVVVSELPQVQQERLLHTINHELFIKIMIDGKIISQCLQYKDYLNWYESKNKAEVPVTAEIKVKDHVEIKPNFAQNLIPDTGIR